MKKLVGILALAAVVAGGAWAQSAGGGVNGKRVFAAVDAMPLLEGLIAAKDEDGNDDDVSIFGLAAQLEYLTSPRYSVGARLDLYLGEHGDTSVTYFGLAAHGRVYTPVSVYVDLGLGYNSETVEGWDDPLFDGLFCSLGVGWKHVVTGNFFIEPSMSWVYSKASGLEYRSIEPSGWQAGLCAGMAL